MKMQIKLDLALVHYPVYNKNRETIGSAVTNLDLHDIARAGRTYGVDTLYIVTPYQDQQELVNEITAHWQTGHGAKYNTNRKDALSIVRLCSDLDELFALTTEKWEKRPAILATSANEHTNTWSYDLTRKKLYSGEQLLILFGTAWGLTPKALNAVDGLLPPIKGQGEYNHLSVRSAAAIVLDRLLGNRQ